MDTDKKRILNHRCSSSLSVVLFFLFTLGVFPQAPASFEFTDANGIEFVYIPAGKFMRDDKREITITRGFYMAKYEVTQKQWRSVMKTNPSNFQGANCKFKPEDCDNLPVERVSWLEVKVFLEKLSHPEGKGGSSTLSYRLPTEAEWEYAARAGEKGDYYGNVESLGDYAWYSANADSTTHPVGTRKPNAFGLYDMLGNVWEWCEDWYADYSDIPQDPTGPKEGSSKVYRGGSWNNSNSNVRLSTRNDNSPGSTGYSLGVRPVLAPPE